MTTVSDAAGTPGLPVPQRYVAILAISSATAAVVIDATAPVIALPSIARTLGVDEAATTLIVALYQMILVTTLLPFAALGERIGVRKMFCLGQIAFAIASVLFLFANELSEILILRVLQGLGASATLCCSGALMRAIYPSAQLGRGIGVQGVVVSLTMALAPSIGGLILTIAPWPWVFACAAPPAMLGLLVARWLPDLEGHTKRFDWIGAAVSSLMFALLIGSLQVVSHVDHPLLAATMGGAGIAIAFFFVRSQRRQERPILPVDLLSQPVLGLSALAALLAFTASMIVMLSLPFRLEADFGMTAASIGISMMWYPLMAMILSPVIGVLSDRVRPDVLVAAGLLIITIGIALLAYLPTQGNATIQVAWRMAVMGFGFGLFMTPNARTIVATIPMHRTASGSSIISLTRLSGQALGSAVATVLLGIQLGKSAIPVLAAGTFALGATVLSTLRSRFFGSPPLKSPAADQPMSSAPLKRE